MRTTVAFIATLAFALVAVAPFGAAAETAKEKALNEGAKQLTSDEIAELLVGKTGTWVSPSGDKTIRIHYSEDNVLSGKLVGGGWSGTGYYGVADDDSVCISWDNIDKGRLRCLDVLVVDGIVTKFNAYGSPNGHYTKFEDGKTF